MSDGENGKNLKHKVCRICSDYLQGPWEKISAEDLQLSIVKGGLSSGLGLYKCALPDSLPEKCEDKSKNVPGEVLIRFHNSDIKSDEEIIMESVTFAIMSEKNLGPKLHGVFPGGRIEQFIPSRSTDWNDFTDVYLSVAREVAKIHSLQMPSKKTPMLEEQILSSLEEYENVSKVKSVDVPDYISNGEFKKEVAWLFDEISKIKPKVVFCHNDLNAGNILLLNDSIQSSEKKIKLIDYEFANYNYRTFDMASYFSVKCFYYKPAVDPVNYSIDMDKYPTKSEQIKFIRAYVNQLYEANMEFKNDYEKEKEVNDIMEELKVMRFGPTLYWIAFILKEIINPRLNLPFKDPLQTTWGLYKDFKEKWLKEE